MMRAADIHARVGPAWPSLLASLGIPEERLQRKPGPCPACGGRDRFTFDNRHCRGDFFCRGCGAGDGFTLLQRVHGWDFHEALARVADAAGIRIGEGPSTSRYQPSHAATSEAPAIPTRRVRDLLRSVCEPGDVPDVVAYLLSRRLWPLPQGCTLRAHASVEYFNERHRVGRFAAIVAEVLDLAGELVTVHVTYLQGGKKLHEHAPRKILSPLTGRSGCVARLIAITGEVLGIAEGIETAIAAQDLHPPLPVWAALNASLLAKFEPPPEVRTLVVFADRDAPGLEAAGRLMERLQARVKLELRVPPAPAKDWAEVLGRAP